MKIRAQHVALYSNITHNILCSFFREDSKSTESYISPIIWSSVIDNNPHALSNTTKNETLESRYHLKSNGFNFEKVVERVAELLGLKPEQVLAVVKYKKTVAARSPSPEFLNFFHKFNFPPKLMVS